LFWSVGLIGAEGRWGKKKLCLNKIPLKERREGTSPQTRNTTKSKQDKVLTGKKKQESSTIQLKDKEEDVVGNQ